VEPEDPLAEEQHRTPQTLGALIARDWRFVIATFAASGIGYLGSSAAPVIVQALIDAGISHQRAGDLGTFELTSLAIVSVLISPFVPHVSHRSLAIGGTLLALSGLGISALSESFAAMVVGRLVLGVGSGLAIAGANATVAAREDAERVFAVIWTLGGGITAALAILLPRAVEGGDYPRGFFVLFALALAALPFMLWVPPRPGRSTVDAAAAAAASVDALTAVEPAPAGVRTGRLPLLAGLTLASFFLYAVAEMALWQFSFDVAVEHGIPYDDVGYFIGVTSVAGLSGGAIAAFIGIRVGSVVPIVVGSITSALGRGLFILSTTPEALGVGSLVWGLGYYFVSPYQIGLAAALDRRGRIAVAATALTHFGYGLGPTIGGRIRQYQIDAGLDSTILVVVIAGATLLSMLALIPVAVLVDRSRSR
jgi:MFS family permease